MKRHFERRLSSENENFAKEIICLFREQADKKYKKEKYLRNFHTKSNGLLKAEFEVYDNIPKEFKKGVFSVGKKYKSIIRLSNMSDKEKVSTKRHLAHKDHRGLAIKVLNINNKGENQDFLFLSVPSLPLKSVSNFRDIIHFAYTKNTINRLNYFFKNFKFKFLKDILVRKLDFNLLDVLYYSVTPYVLGDCIIKYKLIPQKDNAFFNQVNIDEDYLIKSLSNILNKQDMVYDFCIQVFKNDKSTPIDDISKSWDDEKIPNIKIGQLNICKQNFNTKERFEIVEKLSFSPNNTLSEHKPVGQINLCRSYVYEKMYAYRMSKNNIDQPKVDEEFYNNII